MLWPRCLGQATLLVLFAGSTGARFVAADLRRGADVLLDGRVVIVAVVAVWAMHMAGLAVIVIAIRAMDMGSGSLDGVVHRGVPGAGWAEAHGSLFTVHKQSWA